MWSGKKYKSRGGGWVDKDNGGIGWLIKGEGDVGG